MPAPLTTRAAIEAAITARELNPDSPVFPKEFWTHPAVARLDTTALVRQARDLTPITQEQIALLTGLGAPHPPPTPSGPAPITAILTNRACEPP
ncbi:hypothetical protein NI17_017075 [Thermobifida halotolerans]|uniref:Uncharacterized protein n=1 Tax=Thermobifida halotolerans TaxID=483545 RepID=A0A399G8W7_9ACTN|nr:hypothetical protein [Thermobifida halotolerans]UOE18521.1 hypothetical protein NI17_017075 [Thermobifida halotolerans]